MPTADGYVARLLDARLDRLFSELPAIMLTGPRATGKTTTAARLARSVVRLDRSAEAAAFEADPDAALRSYPEPLLLDEWQAVPEVLGAIKRAVDSDPRPHRFLLTGSVRADLDSQTWPGTGRIVRLRMYGLSERELVTNVGGPTFLSRLERGDLDAFRTTTDRPDLAGYVARALRGGFPEPALHLGAEARAAWLYGYVDQLITRDAQAAAGDRDPQKLRRYFEAVALNSAGQPEHKTLYDAAAINRETALAYDSLLANLFVLDAVPAWTSNRLSRLVKAAKLYLTDPALVGAVLGLDTLAMMRDGDLLGRLLDTFVTAQLRAELDLSPYPPRLHHLREKAGRHEVDLVVELSPGRVIGLEIKASATPAGRDARHLDWLRSTLEDRFIAGAVLHTGPGVFELAERIFAIPIAALWDCPAGIGGAPGQASRKPAKRAPTSSGSTPAAGDGTVSPTA